MARWIHEFRSVGERALADSEREWLRRRARRLKFRSALLALSSVFSFSGLILGVAIAADGRFWGWGVMVGSVVFGGYLIAWAGDASKLALLHRRALRVSLVEEFRRVSGDETARRIWEGKAAEGKDGDDDSEKGSSFNFLGNYWSVEEKFEESLARVARGRVEVFEAVGRDGAILWVEGRPPRKVIQSYVWEAL